MAELLTVKKLCKNGILKDKKSEPVGQYPASCLSLEQREGLQKGT